MDPQEAPAHLSAQVARMHARGHAIVHAVRGGYDQRRDRVPMDQPLGFGELLRRYRLAAGLTQQELAEQAGLSVRGLSDLERGLRRRPRADTAGRLADVLALDPDNRATLLAGRAPIVPSAAPARPTQSASVVLETVRTAWLPMPVSTFIGRERELAEVRRLMEASRLVTLTGPSGIGKTRVALEVASAIASAGFGEVQFIELAPTTNADLVVHTVASALGIRDQYERPLTLTLIQALQQRQYLLVLDNCEHVVDACATLTDSLLVACPNLRVLATSREPLGVNGEVVYRVQPLAVPEPGAGTHAARAEAVQLFVERARAAAPSFSLSSETVPAVMEVCRRLDGIPLAIELAAARVRALTPEQIAERLSDPFHLLVGGSRTAPPRQQTLRATLEWSYGLLGEPERRVFERLSIFAGGWTLEAAEFVCAGSGVARDEVLDLLIQLVDKSLVLTEPGAHGQLRYRLLATVRDYASGRLVERGEREAVSQKHAAYFLATAQRTASVLATAEQTAWLDRLEREQDNLRAALAWSLEHQLDDTGLQLTTALADFWRTRGHLGEGELWLERALQSAKQASPTLRGAALSALGNVCLIRGKVAEARSHLTQSLRLFREIGDQRGTAEALRGVGFAILNAGEVSEAEALLAEGLSLFRTLVDVPGMVG